MSEIPDFKDSTEWHEPLVRVAISLDDQGRWIDVCADSPIEFYVVQHSRSNDPVYRMGEIDTGKEMVDFMFNGKRPSHLEDGKSEAVRRHFEGPSE